MPFFRKKSNAASATGLMPEDVETLDQLRGAGADLSVPRQVDVFLYGPSQETVLAIARDAAAGGWSTEVAEPLPDFPGQWAVHCSTEAVTSPEWVAPMSTFFRDLAEKHGAEFDGWGASV